MERNRPHRRRQPPPRPALSNPQRITRRHPLHQTTTEHKPLSPGRRRAHIHHPDRTHPHKSRTLRHSNHPPYISTQLYRRQLLCRPLLLWPDPLRPDYRTHKTHLLTVYLTCYLGLYILWPHVWSDTRFLIPAIPILFYAILTSMDELLQLLARALKKKARRTGTVFFFLFLLGSNIFATNDLAKHIGKLPPPWSNYFAAAEWIKDNTESDVKIACRKPYLMNAIANRKATGYAWKAPDQVIADFEQKGIGIVVIDQIGFRSTPEFLAPAVQAHENRFKILHIVRDPNTYVLKFK